MNKMKVELKGYTEFHGHDGYGWHGNLYINGTKVGTVQDDGWGGGLSMFPTNEGGATLFGEFKHRVETTTTWKSKYDGKTHPGNWEIWLEHNLLHLAAHKSVATNKKLVMLSPDSDEVAVIKSSHKFSKKTFGQFLLVVFAKMPQYKEWQIVNYAPIVATV
jgi:hypothetical protein